MKSIRFRVIGTYLIIIILTISLFETGVYSLIKNYYISNIEVMLKSDLDVCLDLYHELYRQYDINLKPNIVGDKFLPYSEAQIQILDANGVVLFDSIGLYAKGENPSELTIGKLTGKGSFTQQETTIMDERVLSVSRIIGAEDESVGILKLSFSLEGAYAALRQLMLILIAGGLLIVLIVSVVGLLLSNTIIRPTKKLANHIDRIASGNLSTVDGGKNNDEFGKLTDNLNNLTKELKSNKELREQFIASVSHELRTPLTSIKGWIITLKTRRDNDEAIMNEGLEIIDRETDRLTGLVDDLLDFSSFTLNMQSLKKSRFNIIELVQYTCRQMKPRADRLGIEMSCSFNGDVFIVNGDRSRLKQVLINLLDNALKYSDRGDKIDIFSSIKGRKIRIAVKDTGSGIAHAEQKDIFIKHYQGSNAKKGSGIGLALCKEIIELHDGKISISSTLNVGTSVSIELISG